MHFLKSIVGIQRLLQISGLSHCYIGRRNSVQNSRLLQIYSFTLVIASTSFSLFVLIVNNRNQVVKYFEHQVDFIQIIGITLAHIISVLEGIYRIQDELNFFQSVHETDRVIETAFNLDVQNKEFRRYIGVCATLWLSFYMLCQITVFFEKLLLEGNIWIWILYQLPFFICGLRYFQIFLTILVIQKRFNILNSTLIPQLSPSTGCPSTILLRTLSNNQTNCTIQRLLMIRDVYNRIWNLTIQVNRSFGVSILANVGNDFISITSNFYWIFLNFNTNNIDIYDILRNISGFIWTMPHVLNIVILSLLCQTIIQAKQKLAMHLHAIHSNDSDENCNATIQQFSLQLLHQKLTFTAAGLFDINCSFLYTIVAAITTYLIILIQFHITEIKTKFDQSQIIKGNYNISYQYNNEI